MCETYHMTILQTHQLHLPSRMHKAWDHAPHQPHKLYSMHATRPMQLCRFASTYVLSISFVSEVFAENYGVRLVCRLGARLQRPAQVPYRAEAQCPVLVRCPLFASPCFEGLNEQNSGTLSGVPHDHDDDVAKWVGLMVPRLPNVLGPHSAHGCNFALRHTGPGPGIPEVPQDIGGQTMMMTAMMMVAMMTRRYDE